MRTEFEREQDLFTLPISSAEFPKNCRDEAPKLLKGLQYIYLNEELYASIIKLLSERINGKQQQMEKRGRKGMGLWEILVLGIMRQGLNANYDRMHYLSNSDTLMRTIMGIETEDRANKKQYGLTTLKDNVGLLDEATINEINELVLSHGHKLVKKKKKPAFM